MAAVRNKAPGPRGAWQGETLVMAEPGAVIEADDFEPEWFEVVVPLVVKIPDEEIAAIKARAEAEAGVASEPAPESAHHPLDHDGDGKPGGSVAGERATRRRGRAAKN